MWCIVRSGVEEVKISRVALDSSNSRREWRQGVTHRLYIIQLKIFLITLPIATPNIGGTALPT